LKVDEGPDAGTVINLSDPPAKIRIGRGDEADLVLNDQDVSRLHLELVRDFDGSLARDLESKNGLVVNGKRLRERRLRHGDTLHLGNTLLVYHDPAEEALRGLEGQGDVTITRTNPQRPDSSAPPLPTPATLEKAPQENKSSGTDIIVYALALAVLTASLLGLFWLFGS
jgi:pSer/pThr/pTyr-binding forkhead associated (FHA) protein